jgi:hypothetical protein
VVSVTYDGSPPGRGPSPTLGAVVMILRWVALPLALWLLWDAVVFALIPRQIYAPS